MNENRQDQGVDPSECTEETVVCIDQSTGSETLRVPSASPSVSSAMVPLAEQPHPLPVNELAQVLSAVQSLEHDMISLRDSFESKIKYDSSKERMVDTLHKELQSYREDLHFKILRPVIMDLISMHDDMTSLLKHAAEINDSGESEIDLQRSLLTFLDTIGEILERNGVTSYSEVSTAFVSQRQRAIKAIDTPNPEQDGLVAERIRGGFEYNGRVLRPEIISVFKHKVQI